MITKKLENYYYAVIKFRDFCDFDNPYGINVYKTKKEYEIDLKNSKDPEHDFEILGLQDSKIMYEQLYIDNDLYKLENKLKFCSKFVDLISMINRLDLTEKEKLDLIKINIEGYEIFNR